MTTVEVDAGQAAPGPAAPPSRSRGTVLAVGAWSGLVVGAWVWGRAVVAAASEPLYVDAVPFFGVWQAELTWRLGVAAVVAVVLVAVLPRLAERCSWRRLVVVVGASAVVFSLALAFVEPPDVAWRNIEGDYGTSTVLVDQQGPGGFLRDYADRQTGYPTHLSAHPPGMTLLLWAEEQVGLGSTAAQVGTAMVGVALAAVAALVALAELAGTDRARRAAPFLVLAPAAVWHTNADVAFGGLALAGVAACALATGRTGRRSVALAALSGVAFGGAIFFSHGLVLMAIPCAVIVAHRRAWRVGAVVAGAAGVAAMVPLLWGYWWLDGLHATKVAYDANLARVRPYGYFVVANLAVLAVALGPATAVALARLRDRATWVLVGGGLAAVLAADISGLSLAETERIWQPFMPLILLAGAALGSVAGRSSRRWLASQAVVSLLLVAVLRSPW